MGEPAGAIDAADRPGRRPDHRLGEKILGAGNAAQRAHRFGLALDARQLVGVRRHRVLRHAVDALDVVAALLDGEPIFFARAVGQRHREHRLGRVAAKAEDEASLGGNRHGAAVKRDSRAGHGGAEHQAALDEFAGELDGVGNGGRQAKCEEEEQD